MIASSPPASSAANPDPEPGFREQKQYCGGESILQNGALERTGFCKMVRYSAPVFEKCAAVVSRYWGLGSRRECSTWNIFILLSLPLNYQQGFENKIVK
jgi:hypothetical protein